MSDPKGHGREVVINTHPTQPFHASYNSVDAVHQPVTGYWVAQVKRIPATGALLEKLKRKQATATVLVCVDEKRKNKPGLITLGKKGRDVYEVTSDYALRIINGNMSGPTPDSTDDDPPEKRVDSHHHNGFLKRRSVFDADVGRELEEKQKKLAEATAALAKVEAELQSKQATAIVDRAEKAKTAGKV